MWETRAGSQGWEDALEEGMATHSSIPAWRIPWTEEPGRLLFMGSQRAGHDWSDSAHVEGSWTFISGLGVAIYEANFYFMMVWFINNVKAFERESTNRRLAFGHLFDQKPSLLSEQAWLQGSLYFVLLLLKLQHWNSSSVQLGLFPGQHWNQLGTCIEMTLVPRNPQTSAVLFKESLLRDFPSGPAAKTPSSQCRGLGFDPWSGN